jgi:hypothetical protein
MNMSMKTKTKQSSKTDAAQIRSFADSLPESVQQELERLLAALLQAQDRASSPADAFPFPFQTVEQFGCMEDAVRPLLSRLVEQRYIRIVYYPKKNWYPEYDPLNSRWQPSNENDPYHEAVRGYEPEIRTERDKLELLQKRLQKNLKVESTPEIYCKGSALYINGDKVSGISDKPAHNLLLAACGQLNEPLSEDAVRELLQIDSDSAGVKDQIHAAVTTLRRKTKLTSKHLSSKDGTVTLFGKQVEKLPK